MHVASGALLGGVHLAADGSEELRILRHAMHERGLHQRRVHLPDRRHALQWGVHQPPERFEQLRRLRRDVPRREPCLLDGRVHHLPGGRHALLGGMYLPGNGPEELRFVRNDVRERGLHERRVLHFLSDRGDALRYDVHVAADRSQQLRSLRKFVRGDPHDPELRIG